MSSAPEEDLLADLRNPKFAGAYVAEIIKGDLALMLFRAREDAGLTRAQVAEKAGVTTNWIRKLEYGEGNPRISTIGAILASLKVSLDIHFVPFNKKGGD